MRSRGSIRQWAEGVRARLARGRAPAPPIRLDPRLEPLEPRILLSADVGLVPHEALALVALSPELAAPPIEIHDEVLVRESSAPLAGDDGPEQVAAEVDPGAGTTGSDALRSEAAEAADGSAEQAPTATPEPATPEPDAAEQGDPGRADRALAALVWGEAGGDALVEQAGPATQLVVIDARVPEVESLLASLLESTADLEAPDAGPGASPEADADRGAQAPGDPEPDAADAAGPAEREAGQASALDAAEVLEGRGLRVLVLDAGRDGLEQVGEILEAFQGVTALHLVSHGASGSLQLGSGRVTSETLQQRARSLGGWGRSLAPEADILLYGCRVADGAVGIEFVSTLAARTGADVAASSDATGGHGHGDWVLEHAVGAIEATAIDAPAFAAALASAVFTDTDAGRQIEVAFDTTDGLWKVSVGGTQVDAFASPTHDPGGPGGPGVIRIDGAGGADEIVLRSVDASFAGTIELVGGAGADEIRIEGIDAGFAGRIELHGDSGTDTLTVASVEAGFAGEVLLSGGDDGDALVLGQLLDPTAGLSGSFDLRGGAGDDGVVIFADVWGSATLTEAAGEGLDTLELAATRTLPVSAGGSIAYADASSRPERIEGVSIDTAAVRDGLAELVAWAASLQETGALGQQLAGVEGTGTIGVGTAMDLADVFEQLRVYVEAELAASGASATVADLQGVLEGFRAFGGEAIDHFASGVVGDVIDPDFAAITGALAYTVELDGTSVELGVDDPASLAALVSALNSQLGTSELTGRVRAVEVRGVGGHARLGFEVDDATARELVVTAGSAAARAAFLTQGTTRSASGLDDELKGLGALGLNANGWTGVDVALDVSGGQSVLAFSFHLDAVRKSDFAIDLGEAAEDYALGFGADDTLELSSVFRADVALRVLGDPGAQALKVDLGAVELSAEVLNGGAGPGASLFADPDDPVTMNVGFLGAQVGPLADSPRIELHVAWRPGIAWTDAAAGDVTTQVAALTAETDDGDDTNDPVDAFSVNLPVEVKQFVGLSGAFDTDMAIESALGLSALDGRGALSADLDADGRADAFESLDSVAGFADLDPSAYVALLGQIRGALDALRQSEILQSVAIPFVQGSVGRVADLADAFGDALLFDDGDDGIDSQNDDVLVTRLNEKLRDEKLDSLLRFRVSLDDAGLTKLVLEAVSKNVETIQIVEGPGASNALVFDESGAVAGPVTSEVLDLDEVRTRGFDLTIRVTQRGEAADKEGRVVQAGGSIDEGSPDLEDESKASSLASLGNDVAKLLNAANETTFETVQELSERLLALVFPSDFDPDSSKPFHWDAATKRLTFDLEFGEQLVDVELPVDFDFELGPIGNVSVADGSKITVGGDVAFEMTLGLNLGDIPGQEIDAGETGSTDLTSLKGVDGITDIVRLTPSVTADRDAGESVNDDEDDRDAFELGEIRLADGVEVTFGAAQSIAVVAESLINGVINLTSPEDTRIHVDRYPERSDDPIQYTGGRTVPLRDVPAFESFLDGDDRVYRLESDFVFRVRIDEFDGIGWREGEWFDVTVADNEYRVATTNAAKQKLLRDVEKAISAAQGLAFDPVIERSTGSWRADGFAVGDAIRVEGSGGNDGLYVIEAIESDRRIVVNGDLVDQDAVTSGSGDDDFTIVGPGRIAWSDPAAGDFTFALGERIVLTGTEANDGVYLVARVVDGGDALVVADFFDLEDEDGNPQDTAPSEDVEVSGNGAPVRVDPDAETEDATFTLQLMIGDALTPVAVAVSRDGMKGPAGDREEGAASDLSNNRNLSDLVADVQNAIDEAIDEAIDAAVEAADPAQEDAIREGAPKVEVRLDGTRLVIGLSEAAQVDGRPALIFAPDGTVVRGAGSFEADGFAAGQIVVVHGAGEYDGEYTVASVAGDTMSLVPRPGTTLGAATAALGAGSGAVVTQTFVLADANEVTNRILGFTADAGSPVTAGLEDFVVTTSDGRSAAVVLDGTTNVYEALRRINDTLAEAGVLATIGLNDDRNGFDLTQQAGLGDTLFEVESVGASRSALRLGILGADARSDENEDGRIDQADGDDVISGAAVGGASLFDRFYVEEGAGIELTLDVDTSGVGGDAIGITGDFGFFEVSAAATGDVTAVASFGLQDPVDTTHGITIADLYDAFRDLDKLKTMVDPREALDFGGATLDDDAGTIAFSDVDGEGRIARNGEGAWAEDGFEVDQKITVNDGSGHEEVFQILAVVDVGGQSVLELDRSVGALVSGVAGDDDGQVRIESALATLTIRDLELPGGLADFADLGDKRVVVSLLDLGNPFFEEVRSKGDGGPVGAFTAKDVILLLADVEGLGDVEDGDAIEIEYAQVGGALVTASAIVRRVDGEDDLRITLREGVDDATAGLDVTKVTVTRPVEVVVDTPDFGDLLDLSDVGWRQILDGLLFLADFLEQFEAFEFLNEDIPLVGVSVNDLLGYADQFRDMVDEFEADPAGSFQALETRLEDLLGIDDGIPDPADFEATRDLDPFDVELEFVTEARGEAGAADDHQIARIVFDIGAEFRETLGIEFDLGDSGILAGAADLEAFGGIGLRLAVGVDLTKTRVHGADDLELRLLHTAGSGGDTIVREDGGSFAADGFKVGQGLSIEGLDGAFEVGGISADGSTLTLRGELWSDAEAERVIDASGLEGDLEISIYDDTGIDARLTGRADDLSFRAAVGPLGVFVQEQAPDVTAIDLGGRIAADTDTNGDGVVDDADQKRIFTAGLKQVEGDRSILDGDFLSSLFDHFEVAFEAGIDAVLPVAFPTDSIEQGRIEFGASVDVDLLEDEPFAFETHLLAFDETGAFLGEGDPESPETVTDSGVGELFDLSALLDLGELSIFDNVLLAVDGIDFFLGGLQDVLDGEVFGVELPLIGDGLAEGAGFIEDLREGFLADFRQGVEDAEDFAQDLSDPNENVISKLLFDALSQTGLLLVELEDGSLVKATRAGLEAGLFELKDAIKLNGEAGDAELPDLTASVDELTQWLEGQAKDEDGHTIEPEIKWNMKLGQSLLDVDTDLDIDLGVPGLGFEVDGALGLKLGWDLDFGFGLNFEEGFFLDIEPEDGTDLEVNLGVTLPDRLAGELAFLQLDAINDGSGLDGRFVVDVYNEADELDGKLSFSELGKLRVRAEVEAQALASFDMLLALDSDLVPSATSVFPTVGADFTLDWGIGGHLGDAGELGLDGRSLTRTEGTWAGDGFLEGQRLILEGFDEARANGVYRIETIDGQTITLTTDSGVTGVSQSATADVGVSSLQDVTGITGSLLMDGLNEVSFGDITLDLGSFIGDLIAPILGEIQDVTRPLQPIIDLVTSPLPVVSDFAGPTSLIDLAGIFGSVRPEFLQAVADIITLANAIPAEKGEVKINFGDFPIFMRGETDAGEVDLSDPNFDPSTLEKPKPDPDTFDDALDAGDGGGANAGANKKNKDFAKKLKNLEGFQFPFLQDPTELFGLFTGEPVTLVGYDMPALDFEFQYTQSIPLYPPLFLGLGGQFGAHIDFAFGFDTEGIQQFADTGFRNPLLVFNGLFVSDNPTDATGAGPDLPELTFTGGFTVTAELNAFIARAGAGGGLFAEIFFDLFDPDHDGRVRILEIAENFETEFKFGSPLLAPLAIFDVSGNVKARLFAFLEINLLFASIYKEWDLVPPITLVDFDIDFQRKPKLASELPDRVLQLNIGEQAGQRLNGDLRDGDEHFEVRDHATDAGKIEVRALGLGDVAAQWQAYDRPTAIIALGGRGNDVIDFSGLSSTSRPAIRLEVEGGEGNDVLIGGANPGGGVLDGGVGDDVLIGTGGADLLTGGEGRDVIDGGAGDDVVFGDGGRIVEGEARVTREDLEIVAARDEIHRADNALWLADGFRAGQTVRITGSTLGEEGETEGEDAGNDGYYRVAADWAGGALRLVGLEDGEEAGLEFERTDRIKIEIVNSEYRRSIQAQGRASDGDDLLLGGAGSDAVFGSGGADLILGGGATVAGEPAQQGLRARAHADALANGADGRASKRLRKGFDAADVAKDDASGDAHDILVGDAGEIRYRLGAGTPTFRDVVETDRGLFFGADEIHGNGGFDRIRAGQGDDVVFGGDGADLIYGESGLDELHGDAGADEIHGGRDADVLLGDAGADTLSGDEGNDVLGGGTGADVIRGGSGSDRLWGGTGDDRLEGGGDFDTLHGGTGDDTLDGGAGDDVVYGDGVDDVPDDVFASDAPATDPAADGPPTFDDVLFVGGGNDRLDGQGGSDEYIVDFRGAANDALVPIRDTGTLADGIDRLTANGTDFDDLFLLRRIQYFDDSITPEGERFDAFVASINRDGAVERIDFTGIDRVVVNGQQGDDEFAVDDVAGSTELNGGGGRDLFAIGQLYKSPRVNAREGEEGEGANLQVGDFFDTVETTRGWLSNGTSEAMVINAGADDDEIIVLRNLAVLQVNGEEGDDSITVRAFALTADEVERQRLLTEEEREALRQKDTDIEGGAGADLIQYAVNAPVNIDGGDGLDEVTVIGTEFDDDFVITEQGVYGAGLNVNLVNVELLTVDGAEGDDAFFVQSTQDGLITRLLGGLGSDTFEVTGDAPPVASNDLLGHSGLITHGIESNDPTYAGADGEGIAVHGISANVADDDEPFARITLTDGATRIGEDGLVDGYYLTLSRRPEDDERVLVSILAPSLTPEQRARGASKFGVFADAGRVTATGSENSSITVWFDAENWDEPLFVEVRAGDDATLEGVDFGVINHQVRSVYDGTGTELDGQAYAGSPWSGLALPSVSVQIDDDDEADVLVFETDEGTRAFEAVGQDADAYQVRLSRPPTSGLVQVRIDVTPPPGLVDQIALASPGATFDGSTLVLTFDATSGGASSWDTPRTVFVDGVPDAVREGFHRDFIQHRVVAVADADMQVARTDLFTPDSVDADGLSIWPSTSILLTEAPVQQVGRVGRLVDETTFEIAFGELEPGALVGHVVRLSSGPADGQARTILANDATTITFDRAFDVAAGEVLDDSDFRTSDVAVTVDYRELSGAPDVRIDAEGNVLRAGATGAGDTGSWKADGFERDQVIVVEDASGALLGRFVVRDVGVEGLSTERVVGDGGLHDAGTDSGWIAGARVYVAPLDIDRFLVNSSTLVFLDENGRPETREASDVRVGYEYLQAGYDGRVEERIAVQVVDDDTAGVLVTQTGASTDVTEGGYTVPTDGEGHALAPTDLPEADGVYTTVDTYQVVLTKAPTTSGPGEAYVDVVVTPRVTRTSEGSFAFELQQVVVAAGEPGESPFGDQVVLRFTADDWDVPQTVTVGARQDPVIDGNDTQVFAPQPHTVANVQGPLFVDGAGGQGSLEGLRRPVMLDGEISQRDPHGIVQGIEAGALVARREALEAELLRRALEAQADGDFDPQDYDEVEDLVGRTVELIDVAGEGSGPGDGDFTLITAVTDLGDGLVRLSLDPAWDLAPEEIAEIDARTGDDRYAFAITDESPSFFVDESLQVDVMRMNDEDNAADFVPGYPNGGGRLTAFDPDAFPETASVLVGADDPDAFGQGQWGRITGLGMSPDAYIARAMRPGGVTYGRLEGLQIDLGHGDNHFVIDAVHQRDDGVRTYTVVDAGAGDDVIEVSVAAPENAAAGVPFLRIDAGAGDDVVTGSPEGSAPSTLPLEIIGGLGHDTLVGGDGDDLVYGDFGLSQIANVVDFDAALAERQASRIAPSPDAGAATAPGGVASPTPDATRSAAQLVPNVGTTRPGVGAGDSIDGMGGADRLFGGAGRDVVRGGAGADVVFGDYGLVRDETPTRRRIEATNIGVGSPDSLRAGRGNDVLIGGAGGDSLSGSLTSDVLVGDYIRLIYESGRVVSANRLVGGQQDVAASSVFGLYAATPSTAGPDPRVAARPSDDAPGAGPRPGAVEVGTARARSTSAGGGTPTPRGRHRVESGESLWTIAERELGDPYRWPEVADANRDLVRDPNLIEPSWVLRIPGRVPETDAGLRDADAARANLAGIDQRIESHPSEWGFSAAGDDAALPQVGSGPPEGDAPPPDAEAPDASGERETPSGALPDQGAHDADAEGAPAELLGGVFAGLTGWRARLARRARTQRRWLAFDAHRGRFSGAQIDTDRVAGDTPHGGW